MPPGARTFQLEEASLEPRSLAGAFDDAADLLRSLMPQHPAEQLQARCGHALALMSVVSSAINPSSAGDTPLMKWGTSEGVCHLLRCVLLANKLKAQDQLKTALREAIGVSVPLLFQASVIQRMEQRGRIPSPATVSRARVALDVAFAIWARSNLMKGQGQLVYLWLDASPIANETWLMSKMARVTFRNMDGLFAVIESYHLLSNIPDNVGSSDLEWRLNCLDGHVAEPDALTVSWLENVREATGLLATSTDMHNFMPTGMGAKPKRLVHVLSAFHQVLFHECNSLDHLEEVCDSVAGVCTDAGTELGTAEALEKSKQSWLSKEVLLGGGQFKADDGGADWTRVIEHAGPKHAFNNDVGAIGICHICDGCTKNLWAKGLSHVPST